MRIVQFLDDHDSRRVGIVLDADTIASLGQVESVYDLAQSALREGVTLEAAIDSTPRAETFNYADLVARGRLLAPLQHPDPAHFLISGTGLTHLGSAETRNAMHQKLQTDEAQLTDSMRMFRMGLEGGKPASGSTGVQPEWFYKGDGSNVVAPGQPIIVPRFSLDLGDEAEIVGLYIIDDSGQPHRIGFALGNEYSDHKTERMNYLYLAHSKLRPCSFGPEILLGELPASVSGMSRIRRDGKVIWEKEFLSGEDNMSHSIANLEFHHFKYQAFRRPGDLHAHYFGTGTLSLADGITTQPGDVFELESPGFGRALRNEYRLADPEAQGAIVRRL
jgi:hypothetical protein